MSIDPIPDLDHKIVVVSSVLLCLAVVVDVDVVIVWKEYLHYLSNCFVESIIGTVMQWRHPHIGEGWSMDRGSLRGSMRLEMLCAYCCWFYYYHFVPHSAHLEMELLAPEVDGALAVLVLVVVKSWTCVLSLMHQHYNMSVMCSSREEWWWRNAAWWWSSAIS